MRRIEEFKTTNNNSIYKKCYRDILNNYGLCSFCKPHSGCNKRKFYGGYKNKSLTYPSWKLVSKNRKQWMDKPLNILVSTVNHLNLEYVTFKWK